MKKNRILIFLAVIIFAGLFWVLFGNLRKQEGPINTSPSPTAQTFPSVKQVEIKEVTEKYEVSVKYPQFQGLSNPQAENNANDFLEKDAKDYVASFIQISTSQDFLSELDLKSFLSVGYEVVSLNNSFTSIKLDNSEYAAGAAHPNSFYSTFNYNFKDNKQIVLEDLFNPRSDFLPTISALCKQGLKNQLESQGAYSEDWVNSGLEAKQSNFSNFTLDKEKITFIFNSYQVAPYAAGPQSISIPYGKLKDLNDKSASLKIITE